MKKNRYAAFAAMIALSAFSTSTFAQEVVESEEQMNPAVETLAAPAAESAPAKETVKKNKKKPIKKKRAAKHNKKRGKKGKRARG